MRTIKFKAKTVDSGNWVYGYYWRDNTNGKHKITVDLSDDNFRCFEVIPETVSQFTGLYDKTGKEIFEGDIWEKQTYPKLKVCVTFKDGKYNVSDYISSRGLIIGNTHDK